MDKLSELMTRRGNTGNNVRRQRRTLTLYGNPILLIIVASLLPTVILLVIAYFQAIAFAKANLEGIIGTATSRTNQLLEDADQRLHRIDADLKTADNQTKVNILQRLVYNDFQFREAGIVSKDGFLTLTSLGVVNPPLAVSLAKSGFNPNDPDLQILGPGKTQIMGERSIALALPGSEQVGFVYLLVDPILLTYFLEATPNLDLGPGGFVVFKTNDGRILNTIGSPQAISDDEQSLSPGRIRISQTTQDGDITIVGEISRWWALRYWWQKLTIGAPITALISGLLMYLFIRQARQADTLGYELQLGLAQNEFEVHYQPIVDLQTRQCVSSEALIRWRHPHQGTISPGLFLPTAEQTGLIIPISDWLIDKVVQDQISLQERFHLQYTSINLSPIQLNTGNVEHLIQSLKKIERHSDITIIFEITENKLIEEQGTTAQDAIARLKQRGARFAIDDFGTGYSNFHYLQGFDFDYLKLDRLFIKGLDQDNNTSQIVDSLVELGKKLGLIVIAEGIETEAQCQYVMERGIRYGQGWLFSRPLPFEDFEDYLQAQTLEQASSV